MIRKFTEQAGSGGAKAEAKPQAPKEEKKTGGEEDKYRPRTVLPVRSTTSYRWTNSGDRFLLALSRLGPGVFVYVGPAKGLDHNGRASKI